MKKSDIEKYKQAGKILRAADKYALKVGGPQTMQVYQDALNDFLAGAVFVLNLNKKKTTRGKKKK